MRAACRTLNRESDILDIVPSDCFMTLSDSGARSNWAGILLLLLLLRLCNCERVRRVLAFCQRSSDTYRSEIAVILAL